MHTQGLRSGGHLGIVWGLCLWTICMFCCSIAALAEDAALTENAEQAEHISAWIQEADAYLAQEEFTAAYDIYLRVVGIDPTHLQARTQLLTILRAYQTQVAAAGQADDLQSREFHVQRYRLGVRDFLYVLTAQLKQFMERYGERVAALKSGQNVAREIPPLLTTILQILGDLTTVYAEFPQSGDDAAAAQKIIDRLKQTSAKYEQELEFYSRPLAPTTP